MSQAAEASQTGARRHLTGSKIADAIVLIAIMIVPLMYGGLLSSAYHNPTNELEKITAAVVNNDKPVTATLATGGKKTYQLGKDLTERLTNPTDGEDVGFTWQSMTADEAKQALSSEKVRAVLTIPANFSKQAGQLGTTKAASATRQTLHLTTDDGINYLAGTLAKSVAVALQGELSKTGSSEYLEQVLLALDTVRDGLGEAADGAGQITAGAAELADGTSKLQSGIGQYTSGVQQAATGAGQLAAGASALPQLVAGVNQYTGAVDALNQAVNQGSAGKPSLVSAVGQLSAGLGDATQQGDATNPAANTTLVQGATAMQSALHGVADKVSAGSAGLDKLTTAADQLAQLNKGLADSATAGTAQCKSVESCQQVLAALTAKLQVASQLATGVNGGVTQISTSVEQLGTGAPALVAASDKLAAGVKQAAAGASQLRAAVGGVGASTSTDTLSGALSTLNASSGTLRTGTAQTLALQDGAGQLAAGLNTLAANTPQLTSGASQLAEGSTKLHDATDQLTRALHSGQSDIPSYSASDRTKIADVVAEPVEVEPVRAHAVANNGAGFSPMFLSLSLWIGGIAIFLVVPALVRRSEQPVWWKAPLKPGLAAIGLGVLQAVLLMLGTNAIAGLDAANLPGLVAIGVLASLTFVMVNQALISLFAFRGRFISIVLLCLQITSMGATFPVETTPGFFQWIHPLLPMSYTQLAFRDMIAGSGASGAVGQCVAVLVGWLVAALALTALGAWLRRHKAKPLPHDNALLGDTLLTA